MSIIFKVDKKNKIKFSPTIKAFYWIESDASRNINLMIPQMDQIKYKDLAISKGLATFDQMYFSTKHKVKAKSKRQTKQKSKINKKNGEFFLKL